MISVRRSVVGISLAVGMIAVLTVVMLPFRDHLAVGTPGLVLVIPVVVGTFAGGLAAGIVAVVVGFVVYDLVFIPPYGTLAVAHGEYWLALAVYAVVMVIVVRLVTALDRARSDALAHATEARRLFELSELLVEEHSVAELVETIVVTVRSVFGTTGVALLLPVGDRLEVVAASGEPFPESELGSLIVVLAARRPRHEHGRRRRHARQSLLPLPAVRSVCWSFTMFPERATTASCS